MLRSYESLSMTILLFNKYQITDITQNKWIENCKADICIWPDVVEEQDKVLDSVRNNMVDECSRNRNPNEVTVEVSQNFVNLAMDARTRSILIYFFTLMKNENSVSG